MARRVLITGAAGFIGANLTRRLIAEGEDVWLGVKPGSDPWRIAGIEGEAVRCDLDLMDADCIERTVADAQPQCVMHLAAHGAYSWQTDPWAIAETNVLGTLRLLEACTRAGVERFVNAGTSSEYGFRDHAPREDEAPEPNSHYAAAKAAGTGYCGYFGREGRLATVTLRLYSAYGPWEEPKRLIPTLVRAGLQGELPPLVNPDVARDFVYVGDVCEAFALAASADLPERGAVYNVASGTQTTLGELVDVAREVFGITAQPDWGSMEQRDWDTSTWVGDPSKINSQLGWRPRVSLEEGLERLGEAISG
jgi:nucleoside-diphosphate-sugar epimerase